MLKSLNAALDKFKQDLLPKAIYDVFKWLIGSFALFIFAKIIPSDTTFGEFINQKVSLTLYTIILIGLILITITFLLISYFFNIKFKLLEKDNHTDTETGLKNHKALKEYLIQKLKEAKQSGTPLSIILIDIDDFADFNEKYNQIIGDKILVEVGRILLKDNRITDETFRQYSRGDEFIVVSNQTNITEVGFAADRKREFLANSTFLIDSMPYKLTVCCGLAEYKDGDNYETLLARANYAVRNIAKKKPGKNRTEYAV